jgi:PIN domain nuclease of toxin-antitoxin system
MKYLLDTHVILWYLGKDDKLSNKAKTIVDTRLGLHISIISLWEIAIKTNIGKLQLNRPIQSLIVELQYMNIQILPVSIRDVEIYSSLPFPNTPIKHRDPFDRILIAQGINHSLSLLSRDGSFAAYPISCIWE